MDTRLIIANCISFGSALFTVASCWSKDEKRIYLYQVGQCFVLAIAYIFFGSYAGIVMLIICTIRNLLLAYKRYNTATCMTLAACMVIIGAALNNDGAIGWIVIIANSLYTLVAYFAKNELLIKLNIIQDLVLWMIYETFMKDIPSFIADSVGVVVAIIAIVRYLKAKRAGNEEHSDNVHGSECQHNI